MRVLLISINHHHAPLAIRERFTSPDAAAVPDAVRARFPGVECLSLTTCNRFELYVARPVYAEPSPETLRSFLSDYFDVPIEQVAGACVIREQEQAVAHLFRVCCGLESMVLGEAEVLGQVKRAYEAAAARGSVGPVLHRICRQALATAKQARTATNIDAGKVSVGSVAAELALRATHDLADKTVVGIGAGEVAELALRHILALNPKRLWIVNRSDARAAELADRLSVPEGIGGARPWSQLDDLLAEADVIVTSTSADSPIITTDRLSHTHKHRRGRPLVLIDLASPRDVQPGVGSMSNVYLYNIDDLKAEADLGRSRRGAEAEACERLTADAADACMNQVRHNDLGQLIRRLRTRLHDLGEDECERTLRKLARDADDDQLDALLHEHTRRLINKVLHIPLTQLDRHKPDAPLGFYAAALRRLFDMVEPEPNDRPAPPSPGDSSDPLP